MKKYLLVFISLFTLFPSLSKAQLESAHWYFGEYMGLDFTSGSPVLDFNGKIFALEGCASLSDNAGNLLFYTDGSTVYDKTHNIMSNGTDLKGNNSSSQSGFIIPNAYNKNLYYIFTVDANDFHTDEIRGLHYSVVDMTLNSGRGDVIPTQKNIPMPLGGAQKSSEKITAVRHINGRDVWMITHFLDSFYAFLISDEGVSTTPVISTIGENIPYEIQGVNVYSSNGRGYIKTSPNGKKIAIAHLSALQEKDLPELPTTGYKSDCAAIYTSGGILGLYDFNNATGIISNETILSPEITDGRKAFYGIEFSPNSKVLYAEYDLFKGNLGTCSYDGKSISNNWLGGRLVQFDLTSADIPGSEFPIHPFLKEDYPNRYEITKGALQLALDKKIYYVNGTNYHRISVINNPNTLGLGANFDRDAIRWNESRANRSQYGLPPFIVHFFDGQILFNGSLTADNFCVDNMIEFSVKNDTGAVYTIDWDFGDGSPIEVNNPIPSHSYATPGTYIVTATINYDKESVELRRSITIIPPPVVELGTDINACAGDIVELDSGHLPTDAITVVWTLPDGTTVKAVQKLEAKLSGKYSVSVAKGDCTTTDDIKVIISPLPIVELGIDIAACELDIVELDSGHLPTDATIVWTLPDGTTQSGVQKLEARTSGQYSVSVTKAGCTVTDDINVTISPLPIVNLGADINACAGDIVELDSGHLPTDDTIVKWTLPDGTTQLGIQKLEAKISGKYSVSVAKGYCTTTDDINVIISPLPIVELGGDISVCETEILELDSGHLPTVDTIVKWTLPDGTTQSGIQKLEAKTSGQYSVSVTKAGCTVTDDINVTISPLLIVNLGADINACAGDIVELDSGHLPTDDIIVKWTLPDGTIVEAVQKLEAKISGKYSVSVTKNVCTTTDDINVIISPLPIVELGGDISVCETELVELDSGHLPTVDTIVKWTLPDGTTQSGIQKLEAKQSGKYTVSITKAGCTTTDDINVTIFPLPIVELGVDINTCENTVELDSGHLPTDDTIVKWTLPDGTIVEAVQKLEAKISGKYTVIVTQGLCITTDEINVTFLPSPIVNLGDDINTCDDTAELDAGHSPANATIVWTLPDGTTQSGTQTIEAKQSGKYIVSITQNTCTVTDEINVALSLIPYVVDVRTDGNSAEVIAKGDRPLEYSLDGIKWQSSPTFTGLDFGIHSVYVKNTYGCISEAFVFALLNIPNIITPNGDGKNDVWNLKGLELYPGSKIQVFDRYGKLLVDKVFTENPAWDGKYQNRAVTSSSYWYIIELTDGRKLNGSIAVKNY